MNGHESLTVRTVTALSRLATLQEKEKTLSEPKRSVLKAALAELESALEALRVSSEQLNEMVDQMAAIRSDAKRVEVRFNEFRNLMPIACVITDLEGQILDVNSAGGGLLNVAPRHLFGKPLSLYMVDRDRFFQMLKGTRLAADRIRGDLAVRPRERKPRTMAVQLGQSAGEEELVWFFYDAPDVISVSA